MPSTALGKKKSKKNIKNREPIVTRSTKHIEESVESEESDSETIEEYTTPDKSLPKEDQKKVETEKEPKSPENPASMFSLRLKSIEEEK